MPSLRDSESKKIPLTPGSASLHPGLQIFRAYGTWEPNLPLVPKGRRTRSPG